MEIVAKFEKVSLKQFNEDIMKNFSCFTEKEIKEMYENIILPKRATIGSAGYDFFLPCDITLNVDETMTIPTGIRAKINQGWVLQIFPRSGLGFKFRMQLNNTVGIIDSDYYNANNEGHIMCKITNVNKENKTLVIEKNKGFVQGIFLPFGITEDDDAKDLRTGGFGSTSK